MIIRINAAMSIPNQGRKNGKKAIELSKVEISKLIFVKAKISSKITDITKCSKTIKKVACIKLVIEETNYCFCYENIYFNASVVLKYFVVM